MKTHTQRMLCLDSGFRQLNIRIFNQVSEKGGGILPLYAMLGMIHSWAFLSRRFPRGFLWNSETKVL